MRKVQHTTTEEDLSSSKDSVSTSVDISLVDLGFRDSKQPTLSGLPESPEYETSLDDSENFPLPHMESDSKTKKPPLPKISSGSLVPRLTFTSLKKKESNEGNGILSNDTLKKMDTRKD